MMIEIRDDLVTELKAAERAVEASGGELLKQRAEDRLGLAVDKLVREMILKIRELK